MNPYNPYMNPSGSSSYLQNPFIYNQGIDYARVSNAFNQAAGIDGRLDRQEFACVFSILHPEYVNTPDFYTLANGVFNQIDINHDGYIDQTEFLQAYNTLRRHLGIVIVSY